MSSDGRSRKHDAIRRISPIEPIGQAHPLSHEPVHFPEAFIRESAPTPVAPSQISRPGARLPGILANAVDTMTPVHPVARESSTRTGAPGVSARQPATRIPAAVVEPLATSSPRPSAVGLQPATVQVSQTIAPPMDYSPIPHVATKSTHWM